MTDSSREVVLDSGSFGGGTSGDGARPGQKAVLLLGATGRTGRRVLRQLLGRGIRVRVVVRSAARLPEEVADDSRLSVVEADLLSLSDEELRELVRGCAAIVSCLGHVISLAGIFGPPRDLVTRATTRLCRAGESLQPDEPIKFILMSSVSVNRPAGLDTRRGWLERAILWLIRIALPPARDNQRAADFLIDGMGTANPFVQWVVVRPDALLEGELSEYEAHESIMSSLFAPAGTTMANIAHFMGELVADPKSWQDWQGKLPVLIDTLPK